MPEFGIDGKMIHLKELGFIEKTLFEQVLSPDDFYTEIRKFFKDSGLQDVKAFEQKDLEKIDSFVKNYFITRIDEAKIWLLRAYVLGRMLALSDLNGAVFQIESLSALPAYVQEAAKQYGLTVQEALALQNAMEESGALISNTSVETIETVRSVFVENIKKNGDSKSLYDAIRETVKGDAGEINRNWKDVAINEANTIFNNAYLAQLQEGDFVVGKSYPDACEHCLEVIDGKVYRVTKNIPPDYSNMNGEAYEKYADIWENYVWVGKNNYGRSFSERKRINPLLGNRKDNLREKHHHEHSMPACPAHVRCRCNWIHINPKWQWVDENRRVRMRVEDEDKWEQWYRDEIEDRFGK